MDDTAVLRLDPAELAPASETALPGLLALDSATECLAVAACGPLGAFAANVPGGALASARLLPLAQSLLACAGLQWTDLQAIAFGAGPGAFTGLRTACAAAQGLALGLNRPLLVLDDLMLVAEDARLAGELGQMGEGGASASDVAVAMDARMNEVYVARYRYRYGHGSHHRGPAAAAAPHGALPEPPCWQVLQAPTLWNLAALAQHWSGQALPLLVGSAWAALPLQALLPQVQRAVINEQHRARALLHLAMSAWRQGSALDAAQALPLYVRDQVAQTTAQRLAAKAAAQVQA